MSNTLTSAALYKTLQTFPAFAETLPLAIGIHEQVWKAVGDQFSWLIIRRVLSSYTKSTRYNSAVIKGFKGDLYRVNLNGTPAELMTQQEKEYHLSRFIGAIEGKAQREDVSKYDELLAQARELMDEFNISPEVERRHRQQYGRHQVTKREIDLIREKLGEDRVNQITSMVAHAHSLEAGKDRRTFVLALALTDDERRVFDQEQSRLLKN